jgi:hypothetical protein
LLDGANRLLEGFQSTSLLDQFQGVLAIDRAFKNEMR